MPQRYHSQIAPHIPHMGVQAWHLGDGAWVARLLRYAEEDIDPPNCYPRLAPEMALRLKTGCVGEDLYDGTYTILVTRKWPHSLMDGAVHDWWPALAPLPRLLHAPRRKHDNRGMSWEQFASRYRADLDGLPLSVQRAHLLLLVRLLQQYPTVTLLSLEPSQGQPEAEVHAQRRVLWQWLVE